MKLFSIKGVCVVTAVWASMGGSINAQERDYLRKLRPAHPDHYLPGSYVVRLSDDVVDVALKAQSLVDAANKATFETPDAVLFDVDDMSNTTRTTVSDMDEEEDDVMRKARVSFVFSSLFKGFAISDMYEENMIDIILQDEEVVGVEEDEAIQLAQAPSWGLDRINQQSPVLDGVHSPNLDASGILAYVFDSGIRSDHSEFRSGKTRIGVECSINVLFESFGEGVHFIGNGVFITVSEGINDFDGHGTHVSSTMCGNENGVAKGCTICVVKVFDDDPMSPRGSVTWTIAGINHAVKDCLSRKANDPSVKCVVNMSLGGGKSLEMNDAVDSAVDQGLTVVVAAGNQKADACLSSPSSAEKAITVGATGTTGSVDVVADFSNFGNCVDILNPGVDIIAAGISNPVDFVPLSGTSMACPSVAGIIAYMLANDLVKEPVTVDQLNQYGASLNIDPLTPGVGIALLPEKKKKKQSTKADKSSKAESKVSKTDNEKKNKRERRRN